MIRIPINSQAETSSELDEAAHGLGLRWDTSRGLWSELVKQNTRLTHTEMNLDPKSHEKEGRRRERRKKTKKKKLSAKKTTTKPRQRSESMCY